MSVGTSRPLSELDESLFSRLFVHWGGQNTTTGFNGVFNGQSTVYEAIKTVLAPVAAEPLVIGSVLSCAYSGRKDVRTQAYSEANIVEGTFTVNYSFDRPGEFDGFRVSFRNPDNWIEETEIVPAGAIDPADSNLFGCTNRAHAKQYATLLWNRHNKARKSVTFSTELEGFIPRVGDRIAVSHTLPDWGQSGLVAQYDVATKTLTLDRDIDIVGGGNVIILRDERGVPFSPIAISKGADSNQVVLSSPPPIVPFSYHDEVQTMFMLGPASTVVEDFIVMDISHQGGVVVSITAQKYDNTIFNNSMPFLRSDLP